MEKCCIFAALNLLKTNSYVKTNKRDADFYIFSLTRFSNK